MQRNLTANEAAFDPSCDTVEDAFWLLLGCDASLYLYEVHLASDDWSPSGYCWDCNAYALGVDDYWTYVDGGRWWDYSDAGQLLAEFPGDFNRSIALSEEEFEVVFGNPVVASLLLKVTIG